MNVKPRNSPSVPPNSAISDVHSYIGTSEAMYLITCRGDWTISSFSNNLGTYLMSIVSMNNLLHSSRYQDITGLKHQVLSCVWLSSWESNNSAVLYLVILQGLGVDTIGVVDGAIPLSNSYTGCPCTCKVSTGVKTNITKPLDYVGLPVPPNLCSYQVHVVRINDEVLQAMEDTASCSRCSPMNTTLVDGLPSDAGRGVHILVADSVRKGVGNPGHLPLSCPHVRGGNINARSKETFLGKLDSKSSGDSLQLILTVSLGINLDASLATTKWNIHTGTLVGHQRCGFLALVSTDIQGVT